MARSQVPEDEIDLQRRARRRLVGAVALALIVGIAVPLVFDPQPKPLGADVDLHFQAPTNVPSVPVAPVKSPPPVPVAPVVPPPSDEPPTPAPAPVAVPKPVQHEPAKAVDKKAEKTEKTEKTDEKSGSGYVVQLGTFSTKINADEAVDHARKAGFKPEVQALANGQFRVRVGPYADKARAEAAEAKLAKVRDITPRVMAIKP